MFTCLGIETSCDETSASVVVDGKKILSNVVQTQINLHKIYGGVVPEIACRAHIEMILPVIDKALSDASLSLDDIDALAVTNSPGLIGALLVGVSIAKSLALTTNLPLIGVDHIQAHIYACRLASEQEDGETIKLQSPSYPCISMVVSGGHTSIYLSESEIEHKLLGSTTDDAAGEAFDKVAKILGLSFPGGPAIERAAMDGDMYAIKLPRAYLDKDSLDFSFSGIKTAVLYYVKGQNALKDRILSQKEVSDISASFQEAMVDILVDKAIAAVQKNQVSNIVVGGGVACNKRLKEKLCEKASSFGYSAYFPPAKFCTDNAAMVAGIAYHLWKAERISDLYLDAVPTKLC